MFFHKENYRCECALPIARVFLSALFIVSGVGKIFGFEQAVEYAGSALPFPEVFVVIAIIVEVLGGLSILLGYQVFWGANILALFSLITAAIFHNNFGDQTEMAMFMKNVAIAGGLLYVAHFGAGKWSIEHKQMSPVTTSGGSENPQV